MTEKRYFYQNRTFSVEDNLFYENNTRIGYFEDEEKEEILKNNHKAVVDRNIVLRQMVLFKRNKNDNGDFQVCEVPPIPEERISFITKYGGDGV